MKFILILICTIVAFSQSYTIENGMFHLEARASIIGIDDEFDASGKGLTGEVNFDTKTFKFVYDLWEIDTGMELRNDHMHENHLETEEYPEAVFEGKITSFSDAEIIAEGTFSLHGETKPLNLTAKRSGNKVTVEWKLNLKDYNIEVPRKFFFAKLNEVLSMDVSFELKEAK